MLCLGIESTAHTFSCAIIEKTGTQGIILSDIRKIYTPPEGEGIHPREASRHHAENSPQVLAECLQKSGVKINDIDLVSYAAGPGLGPCLRIGAVVARSEEHTSELQSRLHLVCRLLLEKKKKKNKQSTKLTSVS